MNPGSKAITVGVLDTGVDDQHQDLKANFDADKSASCAYGKLDVRPGSWRPIAEHGTHVAGTIAAAKDGKGMVGVAPGVKVSSIRVAEAGSTLFFPENTVCAFIFAADKGVSVTNNSYYVDPWWVTCPTDQDQDAIMEAVRRSVAYADSKGVVNVSAAGNENYNLASKTDDTESPNDSTPAPREVTNECLNLPTELPNMVSVAFCRPREQQVELLELRHEQDHRLRPRRGGLLDRSRWRLQDAAGYFDGVAARGRCRRASSQCESENDSRAGAGEAVGAGQRPSLPDLIGR